MRYLLLLVLTLDLASGSSSSRGPCKIEPEVQSLLLTPLVKVNRAFYRAYQIRNEVTEVDLSGPASTNLSGDPSEHALTTVAVHISKFLPHQIMRRGHYFTTNIPWDFVEADWVIRSIAEALFDGLQQPLSVPVLRYYSNVEGVKYNYILKSGRDKEFINSNIQERDTNKQFSKIKLKESLIRPENRLLGWVDSSDNSIAKFKQKLEEFEKREIIAKRSHQPNVNENEIWVDLKKLRYLEGTFIEVRSLTSHTLFWLKKNKLGQIDVLPHSIIHEKLLNAIYEKRSDLATNVKNTLIAIWDLSPNSIGDVWTKNARKFNERYNINKDLVDKVLQTFQQDLASKGLDIAIERALVAFHLNSSQESHLKSGLLTDIQAILDPKIGADVATRICKYALCIWRY